jgi:hypothetical protein
MYETEQKNRTSSFLRLNDSIELAPEMDSDETTIGLPHVPSVAFLMAK